MTCRVIYRGGAWRLLSIHACCDQICILGRNLALLGQKKKLQLHVCTKDLRLFNTSSHDEYYTIVVLFAVGGLMPHSFFSQP